MNIFISYDDEGRVDGVSNTSFSDSEVKLDLPADHGVFSDPMAYTVKDGELVYDGDFVEEQQRVAEERRAQPSPEEKIDELKSVSSALLGGEQTENEELVALTLNKALQKFAGTLPEEEALELAAMYPKWEPTKKYKAGEYVRHGLNQDGEPQVYAVLQNHDAQPDWSPPDAVSLFKALGFTDDGTPTWVQPLGATDAYQKDDVVSHNGELYISTANGNVWEPGVYGWVVYTQSGAASSKNR